ncbi:MAG: exonuclease domain-containing protein [Ruminococcaceae bacterium]|nr:exonuclease domain-containing protein [Oscillospiraceae bacterium]
MNYIVLDFEWNQPPHPARMIKKPVALHGEIVEIGAVKLDEDCKVLDTFKMMVAPKYYKKMHRWVSALTRITEEELKGAFDFVSAYMQLIKWCGEDAAVFTWGPDDLPVLRSNILVHGLDESMIPPWYNLQVIFDNQIAKENRQMSLTSAMELIGEPALEAHDALNDAMNTACILRHLDIPAGMEDYSELEGKFCKKASSPNSPTGFARIYARKSDVIADREMTDFACPLCGAPAVCFDFVAQNPYKYMSLGKCEAGHELLVCFKFKRTEEKRCRAARVIHEMNEEHRARYEERKQLRGTFGRTEEEALKKPVNV